MIQEIQKIFMRVGMQEYKLDFECGVDFILVRQNETFQPALLTFVAIVQK